MINILTIQYIIFAEVLVLIILLKEFIYKLYFIFLASFLIAIASFLVPDKTIGYGIIFIGLIIEFYIIISTNIYYRSNLKNFFLLRPFNPVYILDLSIMLDKRIVYLIKENLFNGVIILPDFVYDDLKKSTEKDPAKEQLFSEILDSLRNSYPGKAAYIHIYNSKHHMLKGTISDKILQLSKLLHAIVITNDFDIYQKARLYTTSSININILANNMKVVKLPGDLLTIKIIKKGKEPEQGVAYLDDGTMVVVEDGAPYMDQTHEVLITSVIQTSAGRILFARVSH